MPIPVGALGRAETVVTHTNTALAAGSGSLSVFATPFMSALMERAAVEALAPHLDSGESSVGTKLDITHDAATPVGMRVWAEAEVTAVDRRRVVLSVRAFDAAGQIGGGSHERFVVAVEKFMSKAESRKEL